MISGNERNAVTVTNSTLTVTDNFTASAASTVTDGVLNIERKASGSGNITLNNSDLIAGSITNKNLAIVYGTGTSEVLIGSIGTSNEKPILLGMTTGDIIGEANRPFNAVSYSGTTLSLIYNGTTVATFSNVFGSDFTFAGTTVVNGTTYYLAEDPRAGITGPTGSAGATGPSSNTTIQGDYNGQTVNLPGNNNSITTGNGNDTVAVGGKHDQVTLGSGTDNVTMQSGASQDTFVLNASNATLVLSGNNNMVFINGGTDSITDTAGRTDRLTLQVGTAEPVLVKLHNLSLAHGVVDLVPGAGIPNTFGQVQSDMTQQSGYTQLKWGSDEIDFYGVTPSQFAARNFQFH